MLNEWVLPIYSCSFAVLNRGFVFVQFDCLLLFCSDLLVCDLNLCDFSVYVLIVIVDMIMRMTFIYGLCVRYQTDL